ncbi:CPBP family intramembrane glutamic endopeptidase [Tenacibaculum maritimum]|uniref:CPBP family intramembrane glutamic endopeptidase n=1 Tax=Tenacibaculum maritimum TaxID=107401 RepID=UPI0012E50583|nr:type II CAAX endopeptidase family protein [Tenacibaculum maritimum]CAA0191351.1 Putative metal-dependent membrane protease [Tenacibaculum maritimum]
MSLEIFAIYGFLLLSIIAIPFQKKLFKRIPIWTLLLSVSLLSAFLFKRTSVNSLAYTIIFGSVVYYYYKLKNLILFLTVILLAIPLFFHFPLLEFTNYNYIKGVILTPNAVPYSLYFNLDKTLIGIFIIGCNFQQKTFNFNKTGKLLARLLALMIVFLFISSSLIGYTKFEPKIPSFIGVWIITNLFFTCFAEEALFRGLIQQQINEALSGKYANILSITIASLLFGLAHFTGGVSYILLASIAGGFYGYIYYKSHRIESAIALHFIFNLAHLIFFTYPALKP